MGHGDGTFDGGISFGEAEESYAVATVDIDRDGDQDIVVANVGGPNALYLNDGSGAGWPVRWLGDGEESTYGLAVGDLDGDGFPEVGFANSGAVNRLFRNVPEARPHN
jgi:hypothetical protein